VPGWPYRCARELLGNSLPCITSEPGPQTTIGFIDVATGATVSTVNVPYVVQVIAADGDSLYTGGYVSHDNAEPSEFFYAKGTRDDPVRDWKSTVAAGFCAPDGADSLFVSNHVVVGTVGGGAYAVLRDRDGSALIDTPVTNVTIADDGSRIAASRCAQAAAESGQSAATTDVFDVQGHPLFTSQSRLREPTIQAYRGAPPALVNRDGNGLDPTSGAVLWRSNLQSEELGAHFLIGNVFIGGASDGLTAVDVHDGHPLWSWLRPNGHNGFSALTDGQRLLSSNEDGGIDAVDVHDGSQAWSASLPPGEPPRLYATDDGVLAVSDTSMSLLRPTGPAAEVPDVSGTTPGASAGTRLVTKCGRTPELKPEAVRIESGTLVIRMKIVAHCPGGDVLSGSRTSITVANDGQTITSGVFDLSDQPITIVGAAGGDPTVEHEFRFPAGTFTLPSSTGASDPASASSGEVGGLDVTTLLVACDQQGSVSQSVQALDSAPASHTAGGPASSGPVTVDSMRSFVTSYYGELPANVTDAWTKLDPHLANKNGYQDYVNWWSGVQSVTVLAVSPRDATSVTAQLQYLLRDGATQNEQRWLSFVPSADGLKILDSDVIK
jgi:hypothetical protein